jgi:hypothetical protein
LILPNRNPYDESVAGNSPAWFALTGEKNAMFRHSPSCLEGPVSRALSCWAGQKSLSVHANRCPENSSAPDALPPTTEIRTELVQRIRREIAEGRYETDDKWEAALQVLFQRLHEGEIQS